MSRMSNGKTDEIALNPDTFHGRSDEDILSTLVHEMCHLWDQHFGEPGRGNYHGRTWAIKMEEIGLMPSHTGEPGGRKTGQSMTHYIITDGQFQKICRQFLAHGVGVSWYSAKAAKADKAKTNSKTKFTCQSCQQNAWAKPSASLICGDCGEVMESEE